MIREYFSKEKKIAFVALALGIAATSVGSAFLISARPPFYFGMALLFIGIGILEIVVGAGAARKADDLSYDLERLFEKDPETLARQESARINQLNISNSRGQMIGNILTVIGIVLLAWIHEESFWTGIGCAAILQGVATQLYYRMTQRNNTKYLKYLEGLLP